jgi:hypothetical protein
MSRDDREYFERRAETELKRAQEAEHPAVVHAHYMLAELHLERAGRCRPVAGRPQAEAAKRR